MIDTVQMVFEWGTVSGSATQAQVGSRFYTPVAPADFENTQKAIIFHVESEMDTNFKTTDNHECVVVMKCYGGSDSYTDARTVYRAVHDRFSGVVNGQATEGTLISSEQIAAFLGPPEIQSNGRTWPVMIAKYLIRCA